MKFTTIAVFVNAYHYIRVTSLSCFLFAGTDPGLDLDLELLQ